MALRALEYRWDCAAAVRAELGTAVEGRVAERAGHRLDMRATIAKKDQTIEITPMTIPAVAVPVGCPAASSFFFALFPTMTAGIPRNMPQRREPMPSHMAVVASLVPGGSPPYWACAFAPYCGGGGGAIGDDIPWAGCPQLGQNLAPAPMAVPHWEQKLLPMSPTFPESARDAAPNQCPARSRMTVPLPPHR